jgi:hypothetical protein
MRVATLKRLPAKGERLCVVTRRFARRVRRRSAHGGNGSDGESPEGALIVAAVALLAPAARAQDDYGATVANDTEATAASNAEIRTGDIVTGYNSGNAVTTADSHQGDVAIDGGDFDSPTVIVFTIDSGTNDAYADGGFNDATTDGPEVDSFVGGDDIDGNNNWTDESFTTID